MKQYFCHVDTKHRTPYHLESNHIDEVMIDGAMLELKKIISEHCEEFGVGFSSSTSDFLTKSFDRQKYGAFVISLLTEKYYWKVV